MTLAKRTPREPWKKRRDGHWYASAADFATEHLGSGPGSCLVIGSPEFELRALEALDWDCTYVDIRQPPFRCKFFRSDARSMPFADDSFDAVSSTCVLCHIGTGRYGDKVALDGDDAMLVEIERVLKTGGKAALMFGPIALNSSVEDEHRVYEKVHVLSMFEPGNLSIKDWRVFSALPNDYISVFAQKNVAIGNS